MPPPTCHTPHKASVEITSARNAGHRSGGDTRDASQTIMTAVIINEISPIADAGSQPANPEAKSTRPTAQLINHGFEFFGVRRQAHTARPRAVAATKIAEDGKVSTGRQTHHPARTRSLPWAVASRGRRKLPTALPGDSAPSVENYRRVPRNDPEVSEVVENCGRVSRR